MRGKVYFSLLGDMNVITEKGTFVFYKGSAESPAVQYHQADEERVKWRPLMAIIIFALILLYFVYDDLVRLAGINKRKNAEQGR